MTCRSCIYSAERADGVLWCAKFAKPATKRCIAWVYCPGTDEAEHGR